MIFCVSRLAAGLMRIKPAVCALQGLWMEHINLLRIIYGQYLKLHTLMHLQIDI